MSKNCKIILVGVGNILMKDDGFGIHVIKLLQENINIIQKKEVEILEAGTHGIDIVEYFLEKKKIIIIDAIKLGNPPGTIYKFSYNDFNIYKNYRELSLHQVNIISAINVLNLFYNQYPEIVIIGIEPSEIDYDLNLSEIVKIKLYDIIDLILKEIEVI